jgi:hypothetical protein
VRPHAINLWIRTPFYPRITLIPPKGTPVRGNDIICVNLHAIDTVCGRTMVHVAEGVVSRENGTSRSLRQRVGCEWSPALGERAGGL